MKNDTPSLRVPASFGEAFEGGFYGGQVRIGEHLFAIAWAPKAQGETQAIWLPAYTLVPNAASCFDSMANTQAMAEACSPLAKWALSLDINGFADWCVPARDVLELGYRNLKPTAQKNWGSFRDGDNASSVPAGYPYTDASPVQTAAEAFRDGNPEDFDDTWYWSSTQFSASSAFIQLFDDGSQVIYHKNSEARARAVRLIQLSA
ncbi:hypothetical protein [Polaromonas sp.]|uniref:hypothetical protein n=1 Tax=Polaromonas sp. TaxID=1869339 RepID=UPI003BB81463